MVLNISAKFWRVSRMLTQAAATTVPWVLGLLGIGFGALSASWDEEEPGSALGITEIKLNVGRLLEGVKRSAKDEMLRDKLED